MRQKRKQLVAVLAVAVLALQPGTVAATMPAAASSVQGTDRSSGLEASGNASVGSTPPDPGADRLGWENGVWANESIAVDATDGLDRAESARLLNRTMARVETIRRVEFDEPVDLNFVNRSAYAEYATSREINQTAANVQLEALGFIGEDGNATATFRAQQGGSALAFVTPEPVPQLGLQAGDAAIVMDDGQASFSELVLGHELVHALQVQELNVTFRSGNRTTEAFNARRGLIEGDASYVGHRYGQRCRADWDCVIPSRDRPDGLSDAIVGLSILKNGVRYGNGAAFVARLRDRGGWDAVTAAYDRFPTSTEQVIHPTAYRSDEPQTVPVPDRSGPDWRPLTVNNETAADTMGEAGLFTMLWFPSYEARMPVVMPGSALLNRSIPAQGPRIYDLDHNATRGWDGDTLVPYVTDDAGETAETGYVWSTVWDSPADAATFEDAYVDVLEYRGAKPVAGRANTYRIPDNGSYGDAFYLNRTGDRLVIVNAPSVSALSDVREGAAPEQTVSTPPEPTVTIQSRTTTVSALERSTTAGATGQRSATTTGGPGFGFAVALGSLFGIGLVAASRR